MARYSLFVLKVLLNTNQTNLLEKWTGELLDEMCATGDGC